MYQRKKTKYLHLLQNLILLNSAIYFVMKIKSKRKLQKIARLFEPL